MESNRLAGKVAMITGASSGIGCAAVRRFHEEGAWVIAAARYTRPEELAQWEGAERVIPMSLSLRIFSGWWRPLKPVSAGWMRCAT